MPPSLCRARLPTLARMAVAGPLVQRPAPVLFASVAGSLRVRGWRDRDLAKLPASRFKFGRCSRRQVWQGVPLSRAHSAAASTSPSTEPGAASQEGANGFTAVPGVTGTPADQLAEIRSLLVEAANDRAELRAMMDEMTARQKIILSRQDPFTARGTTREAFRPTSDMVRNQPNHVSQMDNLTLAELSAQHNHAAQKERILREIMVVDGVSWDEAHRKLAAMDEYNERFYWLETTPYRLGIAGAAVCGVIGSLMVFWRPVASWYGINVAGESLPEGVEDINSMTWNQVGTWTWSWMEPMIGTGSFVLLCCQFLRAKVGNLNMSPFTEWMLRQRADRLSAQFPQYDRGMVRAWAKHLPQVDMTFFPTYRRNIGYTGSRGL